MRVAICHRCRHRQRKCNGACPCLADPAQRDITTLAEAGECPAGYFPVKESRGLGDSVAKVLDATGIGPIVKRVIEAVTGKPCGCQQRQNALNQLVPYGPPEQR